MSLRPSRYARCRACARLACQIRRRRAGEIVEGLLGDADDVIADEGRAFARAVLGMLQAAFPFQHRPAVVAVLARAWRRCRRNRPGRRRASGSARRDSPRTGSRHRRPAPVRIELRVLDVEHLDALVIDVDVARDSRAAAARSGWDRRDVAARMVADALEEHLEGHAVVQILARMDLVADVDARRRRRRRGSASSASPARRRRLDQAGRTLRPGIEIGPGERAGEGHMAVEAEILRGLRAPAFICSTAHSCRAFGLPRTSGAAKPSNAAS